MRAYQRERARFVEAQALSVVAGYVAALQGTPRDIEEACAAASQNDRQGRQQRLVTRSEPAPEIVADPASAPPTAEVIRPRRKGAKEDVGVVEEVTEGAEVLSNEPLVEA